MQVEYFKKYSPNLNRDMEYKVYGTTGKPAIFFPSQDGRFYQHEDFGIIDACKNFIEQGKLKIYCVDSIDWETWSALHLPARQRVEQHERYVRYIIDEIVPTIKAQSDKQKLLVAGVSLGASHATNFFLRFPNIADSLISLSGIFGTQHFFGDYMDKILYENSIMQRLEDLTDEIILNKYRKSKIVLCCGQGAHEELMLDNIKKMQHIMQIKNIPAWIDIWGYDVAHDWDWWQKQLPYFLGHIL